MPRPKKQPGQPVVQPTADELPVIENADDRVIHEPENVTESEPRVIHDEPAAPAPEVVEAPPAAPEPEPEPEVDRYAGAVCPYCGSRDGRPQGNRRFCNSCRMPFIPY